MPKLIFARLLPVAAVALMFAGAVHAQRPGGFGGPGFGGPGRGGPPMSPAMQAQMQANRKAWDTWRGTHKNVTTLQRTLGGMTRLEDSPATKLTKPQAKAVLAVMTKWQAKPTVTDAQAKQINAQLTALLSTTQRTQIATAGPGRGGPGGGRPGGPGGFGRPGGGFGGVRHGGGPIFGPGTLPAPREYNPLNPATQPMERSRDRAEKQHARLMTALKAAAK